MIPLISSEFHDRGIRERERENRQEKQDKKKRVMIKERMKGGVEVQGGPLDPASGTGAGAWPK